MHLIDHDHYDDLHHLESHLPKPVMMTADDHLVFRSASNLAESMHSWCLVLVAADDPYALKKTLVCVMLYWQLADALVLVVVWNSVVVMVGIAVVAFLAAMIVTADD